MCAAISCSRRKVNRSLGFTLIELLIVVAIIAILAAIAVPNFLEAQTRSKVSRCKADMRSLGVAIEAYRVDSNHYAWYRNVVGHPMRGLTPVTLTTPIAYSTSLPTDPFFKRNGYPDQPETFPNPWHLYNYETREQYNSIFPNGWEPVSRGGEGPGQRVQWSMYGTGPDGWPWVNEGSQKFHGNAAEYWGNKQSLVAVNFWYDPTNGTVSTGDLVYGGPGGLFEPLDTRSGD